MLREMSLRLENEKSTCFVLGWKKQSERSKSFVMNFPRLSIGSRLYWRWGSLVSRVVVRMEKLEMVEGILLDRAKRLRWLLTRYAILFVEGEDGG